MRRGFFGQYLVARGYITSPQLLAAVEYQRKYNARLGELLVALGMLTPFESAQVNAAQLWHDGLFGETAVRYGFLSAQQLSAALETQRDARVRLGEALETLGYLPRNALDHAHAAFEREESELRGRHALPASLARLVWLPEVFDHAGKLLRRAWNLPNKPGRVQLESSRVMLSDQNACACLHGRTRRDLLVGVPHEVAERAGRGYPIELDCGVGVQEHAVQDFARVLAEKVAGVLAAHGERAAVGEVERKDVRATLPPDEQVLMVSFLTHLGQVLVGLTV